MLYVNQLEFKQKLEENKNKNEEPFHIYHALFPLSLWRVETTAAQGPV